MTVYELCERDVVNVTTGQNLGKVDDISFEPETASITGVILYGRLKLFGLLGREEDTAIPWETSKNRDGCSFAHGGIRAAQEQKNCLE
ncbi:MAG: PRC-barrel domain-containing protein [Ruthenibacterium lactatiformans]